MENKELADIFNEVSLFLEMEEVPFKPYAYRRAANILESMEENIEDIYQKGGEQLIQNIPGIGKNISQKIKEYLETGKIRYYQNLKKKYPLNIKELIAIEGLGPKMASSLYKELKIKNLKDLEEKAKEHKIADLAGFGAKTEKNILESIKFLKKSRDRFLLAEVFPIVEDIKEELLKSKEVKKITVAGSIRRMKETIGDVDLLVISTNSERTMESFCSLSDTAKVWVKGPTKTSLRTKQGFDIDLRIVPEESYGAALQYFTGSKEHNIALRKIAISKGLKLNEYGLFKKNKMIAGKKEEEIYQCLNMVLPPPEIRENRGEIELSLKQYKNKGRLPILVELKDIKGDLHNHSNWNGGSHTIEEMALEAKNIGYHYIGISDHTKFLRIENGLNERGLSRQAKEIANLNKRFRESGSNFVILHGCEANILKDGSLDIKDEALKKLDYVIAGVHSQFKMNRKEMTERIIKAMENPYVNIIAHPTGRLLKKRTPYSLEIDKIIRIARETKTILEVNASPVRLDLNDINIKRTIENGVKLSINSDAHHKEQLSYIRYGLAQARRGWAEKKDIINALSLELLLKLLKSKRK
jgi:DNA polymerase (family X)